jgi:hypothetical protein
MFSLRPAKGMYMGEDYYSPMSMNDYDVTIEHMKHDGFFAYENSDRVEKGWVYLHRNLSSNEIVGWLNGACNNM